MEQPTITRPEVGAGREGDVRDLATELSGLEDRFGVDVDLSLARAHQLESAAALLDDEALQVRARLVQANMHRRRGDLPLAARMAWQANAWADGHDDRPLLARSHQLLSAIYDNFGDTASGLEHAVRAVEFLDDDSPPRTRAVMLVKLADDLAMGGSIAAARQRYQRAERIALAAGDVEMLLVVLNNFAYADYLAGAAKQAWATMQRLREATDQAGQRLTPDAVDTLARIQISLGRYADAAQTASDGVRAYASSGVDDADALAEFMLTLAVAQRHQGDTASAQDSLDECARLCRERDMAGIGARVLQEQAELHGARGEFELAFHAYKEFYAAEHHLISQQREEQARTRHAMFETAEARREAEQFREQARRDPLTGLHNRRYMDEQLTALFAAADEETPVVIAMVDLDHFKRINDVCSHEIGDRVLVKVAGLLAEAAATGFAARLGGEEFLVVLTGLSTDDAVRHLDNLCRAVAAQPWAQLTGDLPVTVSVGVAVARDTTQSAALAQADANLYAAKRAGRNRVYIGATVAASASRGQAR